MDYQNEYILKNPGLHLEHSELKVNQLKSVLPKKKYKRIIDIACGAGMITKKLSEILKPDYIVGIDISKPMIEKAKELHIDSNIKWICGDIFRYKTKSKFDLVVCADIIEHVTDDKLFLEKIKTLGNHFVIKIPLEDSYLNKLIRKLRIYDPWKDTEIRYGHIHHYNDIHLYNLFKRSGYKIVREKYVPMPKRTHIIWEIIRLVSYPLGIISMPLLVKIIGGFKIYYLKIK